MIIWLTYDIYIVGFVNVIHVAVVEGWDDETTDDIGSLQITEYLTSQADNLRARGIRRVTFFVGVKSNKKKFITRSTTAANDNPSFEVESKASVFTFRSK